MNLVPLNDVTERATTWNPRSSPSQKITYIDISSIDAEAKKISKSASIEAKSAPSRARQLVQERDILVSTVRPNLNAVATVPRELDGATASTGFSVLRPSSRLNWSYLFHWVQNPRFVHEMMGLATGQSYPAVSDKIVRSSVIPLPPLSEQSRIAEVLDRADALRAKRREAIDRLDELTQSLFLDMFGDPAENWPSLKVEDLAASHKGAIRTGPFGSQLLHEEFTDQGISVLGIDNAVENEFRWSKRRFITDEKYRELARYTVYPGDVLITIMGTCGRCAVVPDDIPTAINTKHLCCITLDRNRCLPEYLHSYFLRHPAAQSYLRRSAKGAIMSGLNMAIIKSLPVRLPPIDRQIDFATRLREIDDLKQIHTADQDELEQLFASLQQRAFRGEL